MSGQKPGIWIRNKKITDRPEIEFVKPTASAVLAKVIEIGEANPDVIYTPPDGYLECEYTAGGPGDQGCLIGQALAQLGVPREVLAWVDAGRPEPRVEYFKIPQLLDSGIAESRHEVLFVDDEYALQALCVIQSAQDGGMAWGDAVKETPDD